MAGSSFDPQNISLEQFSKAVDEHYGAPLGFAPAVRRLWLVRAQLAVITKRRQAIFALVKDHYAAGNRVAAVDGASIHLRMTRPAPVVVKKAVPSAVIKKHDKKLWEAARVRAPYVTTIAPLVADDTVLPNPAALPAVPDAGDLPSLVRAYRAVPKTDGLTSEETDAVDALEKIAANTSWDGQAISFTDGWGVGLVQLRYSSDRLAEIAPDVYEQLAVETTTGGSQRVIIAGSTDPEDTELDGE